MEEATIQALILIAIAAYVIGSIPTAVIVVKRFTGRDVMALGSGNVGTLNTLRATNSKKLTLLVLLGDMGKGALALLLGWGVAVGFGYEPELAMTVGGITAIVGHNYSIFLKLKGGKGLATAAPVLLFIEPALAGVWIPTFLVTVALTRLMVAGQILGTVAAGLVGGILLPGHGDTGGNPDGDHLHKTRTAHQEHHQWNGASDVLQDWEVGGRGGLRRGRCFLRTR